MFLVMTMESLARREQARAAAGRGGLLGRVGRGDLTRLGISLYLQTEKGRLCPGPLHPPESGRRPGCDPGGLPEGQAAAHLYVPQGKPLAWLFTITRNLCRDLQRVQARTGRLGRPGG